MPWNTADQIFLPLFMIRILYYRFTPICLAHWGTLCPVRINAGHVLHADYCERPAASLILQSSGQEGESLSRDSLQLFVAGFPLKSCQLVY